MSVSWQEAREDDLSSQELNHQNNLIFIYREWTTRKMVASLLLDVRYAASST